MVVELGLAEALESRGGPMALSELSSAVGCPEPALYRIMRYLNHKGIVKRQINSIASAVTYAPTLVSGFLTRANLGSYVLVQSGPDIVISTKDLKSGRGSGLDSSSTDDKIWTTEIDEEYRNLLHLFLETHSRATASALIKYVPETFQQIGSLVDVGGRVGTALGLLVKAFLWITGTNFDLQDVILQAPPVEGVVHIGEDMFKSVPKADAVMLMWVLHDWGDSACIDILKKCKEDVQMDTRKVLIIVEAILDDDNEEEREVIGLALYYIGPDPI